MFKGIKLAIAKRALQKEVLSSGRKTVPNKFNFDKIKTIGILFDATNAEDYEIVKRYVVYLRGHQKKVKVLGYFSTKEIPALTYSKLEYDFFQLKN